MNRSFSEKVLAMALCAVLLMSTLAYADSVVIGSAPGMVDGYKAIDNNAGGTYLQNQYSGPGHLPNSSVTNVSPIQTGNGRKPGESTSDTGPTTHTISAPSKNGSSSNKTQQVNVISNGALNTAVQNSSTSDNGPQSYDIISPGANGPIDASSKNNNDDIYGPGISASNDQQQAATPASDEVVVVNFDMYDDGVILYQQNNYIQAVRPNITAPGAIVVNATTRQIYYSKGGLNPFRPAALANLVTAAILLNYKGINDTLVVSQFAVNNLEAGATTAGLRAGDTISVKDAIALMFTKSCCDVANVVAENVSGSIPNFVALMNQTVRNWGCVSTNFTNPTGLNNDAQVTTTYDMAIIMDKVSSSPTLNYFLKQAVAVAPATSHSGAKTLTTSNQLLIAGNKNYYMGAASRMGYTSKARYTIAAEIDYNGQRLVAVVLQANGTQYADVTKLLNFAKVASLEAYNQSSVVYNTVLNANTVEQDKAIAATFMSANQAFASQAAANQALANQALANQALANQALANQALANQALANQTAANQAVANQNAIINAAMANLAATSIVATTDTPGTWQKNDIGWYFVKANGQSASNEWIKQNGKVYCIDSNGYMIKGWKQMSNGNTYYFDTTSGELRYNTWINVSTGAYYLQEDGALAKAPQGSTKDISTAVGVYRIDDTGKALAKVSSR